MNKPNTRMTKVAKLLNTQIITTAPDALYVYQFGCGVLLEKQVGNEKVFAMLYAHSGDAQNMRGMSGFTVNGSTFTFDRHGIEDSWHVDGWREKDTAQQIAHKMNAELERAETALQARVARERDGVRINFGPTSRILLPKEIEELKKKLAAGRSFDLNPSGMGVGYRFYVNRRGAPSRYGSQCVPAANDAKKALGEPFLVYDCTDHD